MLTCVQLIAQAMLSYGTRGAAVYFCRVTWSYLKVDKLVDSHAFIVLNAIRRGIRGQNNLVYEKDICLCFVGSVVIVVL